MKRERTIDFPVFTGIRCLMMPYIQGEPESVMDRYGPYRDIIKLVYLNKGDIGFLTIDESPVVGGRPHRGDRARYGRALHTEVGRLPDAIYKWGGGGWGTKHLVTLDRGVRILLANNLDDSCAIWDTEHEDTSSDGDIGHLSADYPYDDALFMKAGEVHEIGILTPHESLPVPKDFNRQFLRIVSSGVHGREEYFTENQLVAPHVYNSQK
jgi:hypothetical protein